MYNLKKDMEITAKVRVKEFSGTYVFKNYVFLIEDLNDKYIYGSSIIDGAKVTLTYGQIVAIDGMSIERYLEL